MRIKTKRQLHKFALLAIAALLLCVGVYKASQPRAAVHHKTHVAHKKSHKSHDIVLEG